MPTADPPKGTSGAGKRPRPKLQSVPRDESSQAPVAPRPIRSQSGRVGKGRAGSPASDIVSCGLRVTLPRDAWLASFTRAHPSLRVEVMDRLEVSPHRVLFEVRLPARARAGWKPELESLARVESVELIDANLESETYRILFTGRTFVPAVKRLRVLRRFPFPIQNGVASWTVVGPDTRVRNLLSHLRSAHVTFRVDSVRRGLTRDSRMVFTPRQLEVLSRAVAEGYFDVPRGVSLSELAGRIGVASSTLSVTLALIERKLVTPLAWGLRPGLPAPGPGAFRSAASSRQRLNSAST